MKTPTRTYIMKRHSITFTILLLLSSFAGLAQKSQLQIARNAVGKLQVAIANGDDKNKQLSILGEGIKASENAQNDKKTKKWPETWAVKSYLSSFISLIDENEGNADRYLDMAIAALDSAKKLDKYEDNSGLIHASTYNIKVKKQSKGNALFAANDFNNAFKTLSEVSDYFPTDTTIAINTGLSAFNTQDYANAITYLERAKSNGIKNPVVFQNLANIYSLKFENELAIKTLEDGLSVNPDHVFLTYDYINLLLDTENYTKARDVIGSTLKVNERNKLLYFLYGYLQQNTGDNNKAELAYQKALEIDEFYFEALYQLGLAYIKNANTELKKPGRASQLYSSFLNRSEYVLNQAHEINPNDRQTIQLLVEINTRKNNQDKVLELRRKLEEF